jgi:mRNA-degrading endonuclease RelE of RelBE toxin-antitoxin system
MYAVQFTEGVTEDLKALRAADRRRILDKIDEQLSHCPPSEPATRRSWSA